MILASLLLPGSAAAQAQPEASPCQAPESRSFDFWIGDWDVLNRYRFPDSTSWVVAGSATDRAYSVLDGCGVIEHWRGNLGRTVILGFSLRAWDPDTGKWDLVLLWPQQEQPTFFTLEGGFRHGRGEFVRMAQAPDGSETLIRYTFSDVTPGSLRWNDGRSLDGGKTWATSWIMEFSRRPALSAPLFNGPTQSRQRCTFDEIHTLDDWIGGWKGEAVLASGDTVPARADSYAILDGCGFMDFVQIGAGDAMVKLFRVRTYDRRLGKWVEYRMDTRHQRIERLEGRVSGATAEFESAAEGGRRGLRTRWTRISPEGVSWETSATRAAGAWSRLWRVTLHPWEGS